MTLLRRPRLALVLIGLAGLIASLFGSAQVSAETATIPVTVTAIVNGHTFHLGDTITGLSDGDIIDVHVDAQSPPNAAPSQILGIEGRQCANVPISNLFDFTPTQGGNCADKALGSGTLHPIIPVGPPNAVSDMFFTVGEGTTTFLDGDLNSHTIACENGDTCKLSVLLQVPLATDFVGFPITFGTAVVPGPPGAPTAVHATAGNGQATVGWTAPADTGNSPLTGYTVTSSPGGLTCTSATTSCTVTGLTNFTAYTFTAKATNTAAFTSVASAPSAAVTPLPTVPVISDATAGVASATITWSASSPAPTNYTVTSSPGGFTCSTATTSCTVSGLTNGTGYTFTVQANYPGGRVTSAPSATVTPVPPGPHAPGPPTGVAAIAGNGQATVTFFAPSDIGNSALTGFEVTSAPGGITCETATTTCIVHGLSNFTAYTFTVTATNMAGLTSDPSAASSAVTPLPTTPAITNAVAGDASATITWSASSPAPTDYTVTSSPGALTCTTAATSCTVSALTNGTGYTFTVQANYSGGHHVTSAPSATVTPAAAPHAPGAPTAVHATAGNGQATVGWTAPADTGNSPLTGYTVTSSPGGLTCTSATTSCTVTGLANFTAYTFTAKATNAAALTSVASTASAAVTPLPTAPVISGAVPGDGSATITWSASTPAPTNYTVTSSPGAMTCTTATTSCTVSGLTNGTAYMFTVQATYAAGHVTSAPSASVTPSAPEPPGSPTAVTATAGNGQAVVSWTAPADTGSSPLTGYTVTSSPGGLTCTSATTSCTVTGLANFTAYMFTVTATNETNLMSDPSSPSSAVTPMPTTPVISDAVAGDGQATITWSASSPAPTNYTVTSSPGALTCTTATTSCSVSGLTDGTGYTFTVTANYPGGHVNSAASSTVTPTAPEPPGPPTNVMATPGNGQAVVTWTAPADDGGSAITGYIVTANAVETTMARPTAVHPETLVGDCVTTTTTCTVTGLTNFTSYTFTVVASNGFGLNSDPSAASAAVTPGPVAPMITKVTPGDGSVELEWSASVPTPNNYTVTADAASSPSGLASSQAVSQADATGSCTTTSTSCTISGLTNGASYTFVVTANFDDGSVSSPASDPTTPAVPEATTTTTTPTTTSPSTEPSDAVSPESVESSGTLPTTGSSDAAWLIELGAALVAVGAALLVLARRRRYGVSSGPA